MILETERLLLRPFEDRDLDALAAINADPEVMHHFPAPLDRAETVAAVARYAERRAEAGFAMSAAIERASGRQIGVIGLQWVPFQAAFTPAVEVGWRLGRDAWGRGYATEGARAAIAWGFDVAHLDEIVAVIEVGNRASHAVAARLGMTRDPADDFDHPDVPFGHPMRRHALWRLRRPA